MQDERVDLLKVQYSHTRKKCDENCTFLVEHIFLHNERVFRRNKDQQQEDYSSGRSFVH